MLDALLLVATLAGEPGFGGAPDAPTAADVASAEEASCLVQDASGAWIDCADVLAPPAAEETADEAPPPASPAKLVEKMSDSPLAPKPKRKTRIEEELARVGRSVDEFPLAALRRDVERFDLELEDLDARGAPLAKKVVVEEERARALAVLEIVEAVAVQRMTACAARMGVKLDVKTHRMTPGGPVPLTQREMAAALPTVDVAGCERIHLVDQALVDRVKRIDAAKRTLAAGGFGYARVAERRALEDEVRRLEAELARDGAPRIVVPGATGL